MTFTKALLDEPAMVGECQEMCPKKEYFQHTQGIISPFEKDPITGEFKESLAITTYHRSEAQRKYTPDEIRPLPVLQKTMTHILTYIIGQRMNSSEETNEIKCYHYLRDRFRAIAMEISTQCLTGQPAINILQTIALFFIWAGARFPNKYDLGDFDGNQNRDRLADILLSLNALYDQYFKTTGRHSPLEPEFRAFHLLMYFTDTNRVSKFQSRLNLIPPDLLDSEPIHAVLSLRVAIVSNSIPDVLKILESSPIQFAVLAIQSAPKLYYNAFLTMRQSITKFRFPKEFFTSFLDLQSSDFDYYANLFHIQKFENSKDDLYSYNINLNPGELNSQLRTIPLHLQERFDSYSLLDFLNLNPSSTNLPQKPIEAPIQIPIPQPVPQQPATPIKPKSPIREIKKEEPIQIMSPVKIEQQPTIELKPLIKTTSVIKENPIETEDIEKEKPTIVRIYQIKMKKTVYRPNLFKFDSMLPPSLPSFCFISIVVNDSDGSPSAVYARDCLKNIKRCDSYSDEHKNLIFLGHYEVDNYGTPQPKSNVYLSIVRKPWQKYLNSVGCVLHCEDTNDFDNDEIPSFTFSIDKYPQNPELNLNNLIRDCIHTAINPFEPLDLTLLVKTALQRGLEIGSSPIWEEASANSILELLNSILNAIAKQIVSEAFLQYLLPFIHKEITYKDIAAFSTSIRKSKFNLIDNVQSTTPKTGSSWGQFLRENLQIKQLTPFIAPVSLNFSPEKFIELVLEPFTNKMPSEYVIYPDETFSSFSLLSELDAELYE